MARPRTAPTPIPPGAPARGRRVSLSRTVAVVGLGALVSITTLVALPGNARAQGTGDWPNRPIRYIVPFAAGGATDILGRMVAAGLHEALGQPVVVENRPGQGGSVGSAELARAKPDGYTVGGGTISSHAINSSLYANLPYDPRKDFAPITMLASLPNMLVVRPELNVKSVAELIALLKAHPGRYTYGSSGNGTSQHIAGEMFKIRTGTQIQHVPYKGSGPMLVDLLGGSIQMSFENMITALPQVKAGKLVPLAVTSAERSFVLPDVPTMQEAGVKDYAIASWQAFFAPAGTPPAIVARLQAETARILARPDNAKKLQELGLTAGGGPSEELRSLIAQDVPRLGEIVKASGARVD